MPSSPPRSLLPLLSWGVLVLARVTFHHDAAEALHFLPLLPLVDLTLVLGGVGLWWSRGRAAAPLAVVALLLLWWPGSGWFGLQRELGTRAWLLRHQGEYEAWMQTREQGQAPPGPRYERPRGEAARVAFPVGAGLLDNWQAIVHDPSGEVVELERSRDWFGGHLVVAQPLWGDWYWCVFT